MNCMNDHLKPDIIALRSSKHAFRLFVVAGCTVAIDVPEAISTMEKRVNTLICSVPRMNPLSTINIGVADFRIV